jgi:hypothetical protein
MPAWERAGAPALASRATGGAAGYAAGVIPPSPLVRVVDRALPAALFARLARAVRGLGTENLRRTYQTTFWFDLGSPAALPEVAILALRPNVAGDFAGAEWWLSRMRTSDVGVDFHRDRDEARFARAGETVHPARSSVLFLNRCRGGLLVVCDEPPCEANPARAPEPLDGDLVRPWPNRFAVFRGDATHGVLDANGDVPHRRLAKATPLRLAIAINWWKRRPEGVPSFADTRRYPALRLRRPDAAAPPEVPG